MSKHGREGAVVYTTPIGQMMGQSAQSIYRLLVRPAACTWLL